MSCTFDEGQCLDLLQRGRGSLLIRASNITSNDFRPGVTLEIDGAPWRVIGDGSLNTALPLRLPVLTPPRNLSHLTCQQSFL